MHSILAGLLFAFVATAYFMPAMIAQRKMKQEAARIFVLNLLLGWTVTGWMGAFSWAVSSEDTDSRTAANAARWRKAGDYEKRVERSSCSS
ncbi:superinfection immunity protein [Paraburkholderia sp. J67]|uniref:superinfection immunity protein n=1 Tax=Paraburkholderia sp. J67 TaxID=2805435 RepID=UPI002ABD986D|nr:superinfection immunity protein [Paraburkholderia sp. J67]